MVTLSYVSRLSGKFLASVDSKALKHFSYKGLQYRQFNLNFWVNERIDNVHNSLPGVTRNTYRASVLVAQLNVRRGPGTSFPIISTLSTSSPVNVSHHVTPLSRLTTTSGAWAHIGDVRWVHAMYLENHG